jgi:short-subunit dehydrogenase
MDIRNELNASEFFTYVEEKSFNIDTIINNAGIMTDSEIPITSQHLLNAKEMMEVNYWGTINVIYFLLPYLRKSSNPLIINISSKMGSLELIKNGKDWGYRASKSALNMFTKCFAMENSDITMVALHPGHVQTNMGRINPPLTAAASVNYMIQTWSNFSKKDSGKFMNYDGSSLAW